MVIRLLERASATAAATKATATAYPAYRPAAFSKPS